MRPIWNFYDKLSPTIHFNFPYRLPILRPLNSVHQSARALNVYRAPTVFVIGHAIYRNCLCLCITHFGDLPSIPSLVWGLEHQFRPDSEPLGFATEMQCGDAVPLSSRTARPRGLCSRAGLCSAPRSAAHPALHLFPGRQQFSRDAVQPAFHPHSISGKTPKMHCGMQCGPPAKIGPKPFAGLTFDPSR